MGREQPPPRVENTGEFLLLATLRPQNGTSLLSPGAAKCVERRGSSWHQEPSSGGMLKDPDMVAGRGGGEASRIAVNQSPMSWIERGLWLRLRCSCSWLMCYIWRTSFQVDLLPNVPVLRQHHPFRSIWCVTPWGNNKFMLLQFAMSRPHFHGEVQRVMTLLRDDDWLGSTTPFGV